MINGLPWAAFPGRLQCGILDPTIRLLRTGGTFSTFAYLQGLVLPAGVRLRRLLNQRFSRVEVSPVTGADGWRRWYYHGEGAGSRPQVT